MSDPRPGDAEWGCLDGRSGAGDRYWLRNRLCIDARDGKSVCLVDSVVLEGVLLAVELPVIQCTSRRGRCRC